MKVIAILLFTVQMISVYGHNKISYADSFMSVRTTPVYTEKVTGPAGYQYAAPGWKKLMSIPVTLLAVNMPPVEWSGVDALKALAHTWLSAFPGFHKNHYSVVTHILLQNENIFQ